MNRLNEIQHQVLLAVEWCQDDRNGTGPRCPRCGAFQCAGDHLARCPIASAIKAFEEAKRAFDLLKET